MTTRAFDNENFVVTVQSRRIRDWGITDPPFVAEDIDDSNTLSRGLGGNATKFSRSNPGLRFTLNLSPGSPDSAFLSLLFRSNVTLEGSYVNIGTLEDGAGFEGVITRQPSTGRGGPALTDDTWVIEFNGSDRKFGGDV